MEICIGTYPIETHYIQNVNFIAKIPFMLCECKLSWQNYIIAQDIAQKTLISKSA
jgi:hypothetical protein